LLILDGRASSSAMRDGVARAAAFLRSHGVRPCLAAVLVGRNPASESYVAGKRKAAAACGIDSCLYRLPQRVAQSKLSAILRRLNRAAAVHGILLQLPLPHHLDEDMAIDQISHRKDVDGLHPLNQGYLAAGRPAFVPCTPKGVMHLLDFHNIPIIGRRVVVVGRSRLVGRPLALLLVSRHATVTICHSRTRRMADITRQADILIVAAGKKHMLTSRHVRPGAVVVDVGIHVLRPAGRPARFSGDVAPSVRAVAGALSPVPGGVGPETVAQLLANTVRAAAGSLDPHAARTFEHSLLHRL